MSIVIEAKNVRKFPEAHDDSKKLIQQDCEKKISKKSISDQCNYQWIANLKRRFDELGSVNKDDIQI